MRVRESTQAVASSFEVGKLPGITYDQLTVTPDAKRAYFMRTTANLSGASMASLDLTNGNVAFVPGLGGDKYPRSLQALDEQRILYVNANDSNVSPVVFYDAGTNVRSIVFGTMKYVHQVQYDAKTGAMYLLSDASTLVKKLERQQDGTYKMINLGLPAFTEGRSYEPLDAPFVFVRR